MRILILDLLAERSEFGHGGNIEMVKPFTKLNSNLEVLLITPQYEDLVLLKEKQKMSKVSGPCLTFTFLKITSTND